MVLFSTNVFQGYVRGTTAVYTVTHLSELLGSAESVHVSVIVSAATGTGPTLTCQFENSPDGVRWVNQTSTPELNAFALSPDAHLGFKTAPNVPVQNRVRIRISLGGTSPAATLRLWAIGRSPDPNITP